MKALDRRVRVAVRKWLHLPKDFPSVMIHAKIVKGGLGIPRILDTTIERRNGTLKRLKDSRYAEDPYVQVLLESMKEDKTKPTDDSYIMYYKKIDGRGLRTHGNGSGYQSKWVRDPPETLKSRNWLEMIQTRAGTLETPARLARQKTEKGAPSCKHGCMKKGQQLPQRATLNHIVSICHNTKGLRQLRHNLIVTKLTEALRKKKYKTIAEPRIPYKNTFLKPDLVAYNEGKHQVLVLDPTITGAECDLEGAEERKREKYDVIEVWKWIWDKYRKDGKDPEIVVAGIAINWRGAWATNSYQVLKEDAELPAGLMEILSQTVLQETFKIWRISYRDNKTN